MKSCIKYRVISEMCKPETASFRRKARRHMKGSNNGVNQNEMKDSCERYIKHLNYPYYLQTKQVKNRNK